MNRVIAAINSSLAAGPVLAMAKAIAPLLGAEVVAVHVVEEDGQTVASQAEGAGVSLRLLHGEPLAQLTCAVSEADVVALAIGANSHAVGRRVGHLPLAIASATNKPVVVIDPAANPPNRLHRVLIAIEGTASKGKALKRAIQLIEANSLEVVVVHVDDEGSIPSFSDQVQHETDAYAREFVARFLPGLPATRLELRIGTAADEILAVTEQTDAELLAIGWPQVDDGVRGQVARELLERSRIPVLLVATA